MWQGEGWYTFRTWVNTDGMFTVQDWASPEKPEPVWVESQLDFEGATEMPEGCECVVEYLGDGEEPEE